jgi:hypothetical protein
VVGLLEVLSRSGVDQILRSLISSSDAAYERSELEDKLVYAGSASPSKTIDDLISVRLIHQVGARLGISRYGYRVALLLDAMIGGNIQHVIRRLERLEGFAERYHRPLS